MDQIKYLVFAIGNLKKPFLFVSNHAWIFKDEKVIVVYGHIFVFSATVY